MVESSEDLVENARREEREGCFAQAECLWRSAFALTSSHSDSEAALVAREFGLFLRRFLPTSRQPAHYLRVSAEIERNLDARSADVTLLELATSLIATCDFEDAEEVLASIREFTPLVALCRGKLLLKRGAVLDAEAIFRAALESPHRAEALTLLGETLLAKEEFEEGARVLSEAMREWGLKRGFLSALALYLQACEKVSAVEEANDFCASLVSQMEDAHPYDKCEVLLCWADTYPWNQEAGLQYFQALRLYRSLRPVSAYVAVVLSRLFKFFCAREVWKAELRAEARRQLLEVWMGLPEASLLMRVDRSPFGEGLFAEKLLRAASDTSDTPMQGDVLLALSTEFHRGPTQDKIDRAVEVFAERNPSTKLLADIYDSLSCREEETLEMFRLLRMSPARTCSLLNWTAAQLADEYEDSLEWAKHEVCWREALGFYEEGLSLCRREAPISWMTASQLQKLGKLYQNSRCQAEALQCFQEALQIATSINPDSLRTAEYLLDVASLQSDTEELVNRAAEIVAHRKVPNAAMGRVCLRLSTLHNRREAFSSFFAGFAAASPSVRLNRVSLLSEASEQLGKISVQELKRMLALFSGTGLCFPRTEHLLKALQRDSDIGDTLPEAGKLPDALLTGLCEVYRRQSRSSDVERIACLVFSKSWRHINNLRNSYGGGCRLSGSFKIRR